MSRTLSSLVKPARAGPISSAHCSNSFDDRAAAEAFHAPGSRAGWSCRCRAGRRPAGRGCASAGAIACGDEFGQRQRRLSRPAGERDDRAPARLRARQLAPDAERDRAGDVPGRGPAAPAARRTRRRVVSRARREGESRPPPPAAARAGAPSASSAATSAARSPAGIAGWRGCASRTTIAVRSAVRSSSLGPRALADGRSGCGSVPASMVPASARPSTPPALPPPSAPTATPCVPAGLLWCSGQIPLDPAVGRDHGRERGRAGRALPAQPAGASARRPAPRWSAPCG